MYCKNCGKEVEEGKKFCSECGTKIETIENNANNVVEIVDELPNTNPIIEDTSDKESGNNNSQSEYSSSEQTSTRATVVTKSKSKIAAGLFGIFLGSLGIHNFYLGYTGKAVAQLLITILSCGILALVSEIWGFIEGILILAGEINTDAEGNPLSE